MVHSRAGARFEWRPTEMEQKTLHTLEFPKVLEHLAAFCAFTPSAEKARQLHPTSDFELAQMLQSQTSEASRLLSHRPDLSIGAAHDIRKSTDLAKHGGVLTPQELLDIKSTLIAARTLLNLFHRIGDAYPHLARIASRISLPAALIDAISATISERGDILDSASENLANIRRDLRLVHDRLLTRLQRIITDPKYVPLLQETLITQREGRYVLPLRAEFKGRIKSIVHDQSASGATLFIEPLSIVDLNNQYREAQLAERDEERRILTRLSQMIGDYAEAILQTVDAIAELDFAFARAKYAQKLVAVEPVLHRFPNSQPGAHPGCVIRLLGARHPLLDPQTVVPIDLELDPQTYALVITGPNTGGKTVTLKTVGLLALMAQSGLHIPALSESEISVFEQIFADIGDEQSIEQSLSTFSGHITNIIRILKHADHHSLVILDELGAGTDPQEGSALARALLSHLLQRRIPTLVTTHHPELKAFAHATPGATNASMEFDLETLRPTYRLTIGLPGRSNAIAIAERLGMPEQIIRAARAQINPTELHADDLLGEIHRQRELARQARLAAEQARQAAEELRAKLASQIEKIEEEREQILEQAKEEARVELQALQEQIRQARRALARAMQPLETVEAVQEQVAAIEEALSTPVERLLSPHAPPTTRGAVRPGDRVYVRSLNAKGVVTSLGEDEIEVQVGRLRVRAHRGDVAPLGSQVDEPPAPTRFSARRARLVETPAEQSRSAAFELPASPGIELDLRGQRADEALLQLDRYLDAAYLAGLPWVRIIHGKGTGKLRQAVRQALSQHPQVSSVQPGGENEGGEGVTIVNLKH